MEYLIERNPFLDHVSSFWSVIYASSSVASCHTSSKILGKTPFIFLKTHKFNHKISHKTHKTVA